METATRADRAADAAGGLLLVDKPAGITSHDVVAIVRRATHTRRVGHTGTLDPFATGLLVVLAGRGTRLIPYVDGDRKTYDALVRFGAETDTDDLTGSVVREAALPSDAAIGAALSAFSGEIRQRPPAYSAKQVAGRRAYAAARAGTPLDLPAITVRIHDLSAGTRDGADLSLRITCSAGTYIRAIARDLGRLTNSAAHLAALRRVASGPFSVADAVTIADIKAGNFTLAAPRDAIPFIPSRALQPSELERVLHGNWIDADETESRVALVDADEQLVAIAEREGSQLRPRIVMRDA
jgi:tRNA pseudouridine55 synthase